jgi:DNA-binding transcriptional MerR regulator
VVDRTDEIPGPEATATARVDQPHDPDGVIAAAVGRVRPAPPWPARDGPVEAPPTDGPRYTIDELAAMSGVPSRTIRFYQSKGTLPAPERRGRVAYYGVEHVDRLRVIAELQDRGLRLDAIRDALAEVDRGGKALSLQAWLGMGDELQAPWSDDRPIVLDETELIERVGNRPGLVGELRRLGFIERQGNTRPATYVVPSAVLLDIGIELGRAGIDPLIAFEASQIMRRRLALLTDELVHFWADHTGEGFGGSGEPAEIAKAVDALRPQGLRAVQVIFAHEIERSLRELVERGGAMPQARRPRGAAEGAEAAAAPDGDA